MATEYGAHYFPHHQCDDYICVRHDYDVINGKSSVSASLLDAFISHCSWSNLLYSMISQLMTSPLAVTLGLSLTIPLAVIGDLARGTQIGGLSLLFGALLVLAGFVAVGWADYKEQALESESEIVQERLINASFDSLEQQ